MLFLRFSNTKYFMHAHTIFSYIHMYIHTHAHVYTLKKCIFSVIGLLKPFPNKVKVKIKISLFVYLNAR